MIIYRPHRGSLDKAMAEAKEFESLQKMLEYICNEHNSMIPWFKLSPLDLDIALYSKHGDERVGWNDLFIVTIRPYQNVNDKLGYHKYFCGEEYDFPCGVMGFFSTNYRNGERFYE